MNSSIESSSPTTTTTAIATNKEDSMLLSPSSASPINNDVVDEILKQATPPSPSVLINSYVYTPTKHILSLDGGSSRSNSSNSINTSSPTGQPQQQTEKQQQKRQNKSQRQSHQKTSPIPLKYSPTLLSASSPILARASPVNVALRHQSQSPLASKEKTQPVLSPQSVASGRRLLQRKRKRGHFEKNHLHHLRNRRTHGSQTIDRRIQALTKQNPIKRDALPDILTINDIREELMMLILRYLPRNKDFLNNILLTSKRMWKIGNSHWCWIDVNDILPPTPSPPPTTVMCMSSSIINNNNNINISTEEDEHQVVLNHPRYSKRLNWANFKFINCRKKGNSTSSSSSSSNNNNNHEIEDDSNTNKNTSTPPSKDKGNSSKGSSSSSSCYYSGTEGDLFKALQRSTGKFIAIKKARVYPRQEGVPYYMLRELSFLKNLSHPNISQLKNAYLHKDQLYCFFDFIEYTLHEVINPMRSRNCGEALSEKHAKMFTLQILDGIRYCHSRGVLHRNLKPKHLLVKMRDPNDLSTACIKICDFALVRSTNIPIRTYTNEVVTLWYRPPEVLMGDKYFLPIDVWSIGCIFGEMLLGKPLFPGISEIDQLFQIFSTLGTPSRSEWEGFQELPNYSFAFPNWKQKNISKVFPKLSANGRHLLLKTLVMDPRKRISAREAVAHPYFSDLNYNNCHVPSFPPRGGHRALGLRINHMDTIEKVNTSISIDLQPLQKKQKRNGIVVSADDTTTTTTTTTSSSSNNNNEAADAMMMINSTEMEESSIAVNKKVGGYTFHYLGEFHAFLRTVENERFPLVDWMALHNIISLNHREMLVDWLVEVVDVFDMSIRSVYLAVQFVDRYIGQKLIKRESFQLVGATCLHIASKCEDVSYIGVEDLAVCADNVYLSQDVLSKEEEILNDLDFNLSSATVLDFVILYLEYFPYTERKKEVVWLSRYLCELSLQQYDLSVLARPSKVAAACICWALHCLKLPKWESWLSAISGYHWRTVEALYGSVANMHKKINDQSNKLKVIKQRYSKPRRMQVALIEIPKV